MKLNSNVTIITSGLENKIFIEKYAKLIRNIFKGEILIITTGNIYLEPENFKNMKIKNISIPYSDNFLGRVKFYFLSQFLVSKNVPTNGVFLFFLSQSLIIPMLKLKILKKPTYLVLGSSDYKVGKIKGGLNLFLIVFEKIAFRLVNYICLYSKNLIKELNLQKYESKIKIAHRHYLDLYKFDCINRYEDRGNLVGFIGRLSPEKGIINFVKAMPNIIEKYPDITFLIIGDGILRSEVLDLLNNLKLNKKVKIIYNVEYEEIPFYLNKLKLLVLPSFTEGLPNIVLESMACGTPVLSNSIGAVPDIIINGKNGFLMKNNDPEHISENVNNILKNNQMNSLIIEARQLIEKKFSFESVISSYKQVFTD